MHTEDYLRLSIREFERLKSLGDRAMAQLADEDFAAAMGEGDNSVAVIVKHVSGNLISRWTDFLNSDGEKPDRQRDREFELGAEDTREALLAKWEAGWRVLFETLRALSPSDLDRIVTIRGEPHTVLQTINRQLSHYAYHVGQIVYVSRHYCAGRWQTLSIPRGGSERFNQSPTKYVQ